VTDLLARPDALADYRGVAYDPTDFHAVKMLEVASDYVRSETTQHFTPVTDDTVELRGNWTWRLWLPQRPVTALTAVAVRLPAFTIFQNIPGLSVSERGLVDSRRGGWPDWRGPESTVRVTYSHGSWDLPPGVEGIVLAIAARRITDPVGGTTREQIGGYSYERAVGSDGQPIFVTTDERNLLQRIRDQNLEHV